MVALAFVAAACAARSAADNGPGEAGPPVPPVVCGSPSEVPATYQHVVVIMEENRTWPQVGGVGFDELPTLHAIAQQCAMFRDWSETNPEQNSLTQYIGLTSGVDNPTTVDDCAPSATCGSTDDNIFRQVRASGGSARTFVEGATKPCSASGNASKHVPALYYSTVEDRAACQAEVRPLRELDPDQLPTFAMIVPDLCNDGHDCANAVVDEWLADVLGRLLSGVEYRSGMTAVFVLYDEDRPVPNLVIAPTAVAGPLDLPGAGHGAALRTFEEMLGLPLLPPVAAAPSLRSAAHV